MEQSHSAEAYIEQTAPPPGAPCHHLRAPIADIQEAQKLPKKLYSIFERPNREAHSAPIIDITTTSTSPILVADTGDASEMNSIAGPSNQLSSSQIISSSQGTRHDPIMLNSYPAKPPNAETKLLIKLKPINPFFAPRARKDPLKGIPNSPQKDVKGKQVSAPYPTAENQHTRGPQSTFTPSVAHNISHRCSRTTAVHPVANDLAWLTDEIYDPLNSHVLSDSPGEIDVTQHLNNIPHSHRHLTPALSRFEKTSPADISPHQSYWAEKWRPKRAEECLGNEENALYLRDWLRSLALNPPSDSPGSAVSGISQKGRTKREDRERPHIIRAVASRRGRPKKRRRLDSSDDEDSWVVSDTDFGSSDDESLYRSDPASSSDDELLLRSEPVSVSRSVSSGDDTDFEVGKAERTSEEVGQPDTNPSDVPIVLRSGSFRDRLTNTILLTGPHGSGKTAAVYACAEELGWDIFEVYPGIGKRSGANLDDLVGDVGRNHIVKLKQRNSVQSSVCFPSSHAVNAGVDSRPMLRRPKRRLVEEDIVDLVVTPTIYTTSSPAREGDVRTPDTDRNTREPASVTQSIILLEEVDVLYKDDTNFWPSVINLIRNCRRPVIMTCNGGCDVLLSDYGTHTYVIDPSLVPCESLPMQTTLNFIPTPSPLAISYLQCLGLAEGHIISSEQAQEFYRPINNISTVDIPDFPTHPYVQPLPLPDLRRAIHNLHFHCSLRVQEHRHSVANQGSEGCPSTAFHQLQKFVDAVSFTNSYMSRCNGDIFEVRIDLVSRYC